MEIAADKPTYSVKSYKDSFRLVLIVAGFRTLSEAQQSYWLRAWEQGKEYFIVEAHQNLYELCLVIKEFKEYSAAIAAMMEKLEHANPEG